MLDGPAAGRESAGAPASFARTRNSSSAQHSALAPPPDGLPVSPTHPGNVGSAEQAAGPGAAVQRLRALERCVRSLEQSLGAAHPQARPALHSCEALNALEYKSCRGHHVSTCQEPCGTTASSPSPSLALAQARPAYSCNAFS